RRAPPWPAAKHPARPYGPVASFASTLLHASKIELGDETPTARARGRDAQEQRPTERRQLPRALELASDAQRFARLAAVVQCRRGQAAHGVFSRRFSGIAERRH